MIQRPQDMYKVLLTIHGVLDCLSPKPILEERDGGDETRIIPF